MSIPIILINGVGMDYATRYYSRYYSPQLIATTY